MTRSRREFLKTLTASTLAASFVDATRATTPAALAAPASSHVASVRCLGPQFLENSVGVTGADCASSIHLPSGDALWIFGDTVEGPFESIRKVNLTPLWSN